MKIFRSTKCSLKFSNKGKISILSSVLLEYGKVVNSFIEKFWEVPIEKKNLLKDVIKTDTWLSARFRKVAAREASDLILSAKESGGNKPHHSGKSMHISSTIARLEESDKSFDRFIHLSCIGNGVILDIPIKLHKHYNKLVLLGKRLNDYIITEKYVQFVFEVNVGSKNNSNKCIGIDTGINSLASLNTGEQFGTDIKNIIEKIKRRRHGSKNQKRARCHLKQRMDAVAIEVFNKTAPDLIVVENLKGLSQKTKVKRRLTKNMRRSIGNWAYRYWLGRLQRECEMRRSRFRSVSPYKTSQRCSICSHTDRRNRSREKFLCQKCGYTDNADVNAAKNILERFLTGRYGVGCKDLGIVVHS